MACEFVLGCLLNLVVLFSMETTSKLLGTALPIFATIGLVCWGWGGVGGGPGRVQVG